MTARAVSEPQSFHFDSALVGATAKAILEKLDVPRRKSENPVKPIIVEFFGTSKAGKDTNLTGTERRFHKRGFSCLIRQESAENDFIRGTPRGDPYAFEMTHFAYNFRNLIEAISDRRFHAIFLNRGLFDNLVHLEWHFRNKRIAHDQYAAYKEFALTCAPWMSEIDAIVQVTCSVKEALFREFGNDPNPKYGSRMNPKALNEMLDIADSVRGLLAKEFPTLSIIRIDTTGRGIDETSEEIFARLVEKTRERFQISENEMLLEEPLLMRQRAVLQPSEIKFKGHVAHDLLRTKGWSLISATTETDVYLTQKGLAPLTNDECFHIRKTGGGAFFIFKWGAKNSNARTKLDIPLFSEADEIGVMRNFQKVVALTKKRVIFRKGGFVLSLDTVDKLGEFTEIKGPDENADFSSMVEELGLSSEDIVLDTYLRMFLKG